MRTFVLIMLLCTSAQADDYFYARIGMGSNNAHNDNDDYYWEGENEIGGSYGLGYRHQIRGDFYGDLSYTHYSQVFLGAPFNDKSETATEHLYYYVEYRL